MAVQQSGHVGRRQDCFVQTSRTEAHADLGPSRKRTDRFDGHEAVEMSWQLDPAANQGLQRRSGGITGGEASITDECIGWDRTVKVIEAMVSAHRRRPAVTSV
jgi:hypothetical protein